MNQNTVPISNVSLLSDIDDALGRVNESNCLSVRDPEWVAGFRSLKSSINMLVVVNLAQIHISATQLKNFCLIAAYLEEFNASAYEAFGAFEHHLRGVLVAVFSDNKAIQNKMCLTSLEHSKSNQAYLTEAVYSLLQDDVLQYELHKNKILEKKSIAKWATLDLDIMDSIWNDEIEKLNLTLLVLCTKHKRSRNDDPVLREYFSIPGTVYAKIARMRGMIVSSSIPYIPHHLLECDGGDEKCELYEFMKRPPFVDYVNL